MSELRQRPVVPKDTPNPSTTTPEQSKRKHNATTSSSSGISILDLIRVLATLIIVSCGLSYYVTSSESLLWGYKPWFTKWPLVVQYLKGPITLTPQELALYDGTDPTRPIYLAVNGTIFDVSANPAVYGPGGNYGFFAGRDATRAFVTGCFREDLTDDLSGVEEMFIPLDDPEEDARLSSGEKKIRREKDLRVARARVEKQVRHWVNFFRNHERYFEVGRVVGGEQKRESGEKGKKRELCEGARKQRPKRRNDKEA